MSIESSTRFNEDAEGKERIIAELEDRIRVLEDKLRSKRGRAEDSLPLMRYILDQARDEASLVGSDGRFYYVNDAKCRSLGYTREELLSMHVWDVDLGITKDKWMATWQYIKMRGFKAFETCHCMKSGHVFRTEVSATHFDLHGREYLCAFVRDITERKRAEDALRESEEKYRELVENANSIILRFDVRGNLTFFNEYAERLFGFSKDEVLGRNVLGTIVPSSESTGRDLKAIIEDIRRNPERYRSNVNENVCKNGDRVWIAWTNKAIRDEHGNVVEILSVGNDVTERKRAEEALQVSEERLRRARSAGRIGLYEWNVDRGTMYFSPEAYELYGYEPGSLITYEDWLPCVYPVDREVVERRFAENQEKARRMPGFTSQIEYRVLHGDGTVLWLEVQSTYTLEGGDLVVRGAVRDITERKRAEDALRESEEKFRVLAEMSPSAIFVYQGDRPVYANPAALALTGFSMDELLSKNFWDIAHPEYREMVKRYGLARQRGEQVPTRYEVKFITKSEEGRWVELTAGRLQYRDMPAAIVTVYDITERKRAEKALRENERNLARAQAISHIGNWYIDPATKVGSGSDEFFRIFGVPRREVFAYSEFIELVHPDDRPMALAVFEEVKRTHQRKSFDFRIVRPDGEERYIFLDGEFTLDGEGRSHMFGTMQDITERKRAEEALRVSEERLRRASRAGQTGLYEWNLDRGTAYLSPEAYELYGLEPCSTVTFESFFATVHPDDRVMVERTIAVARGKARDTSSVSTHVEFRAIHPDGTVLWLLVTATCSIEGGDLIARGAVRDITDRKRAEKELWMNKEKFRVLADTSFGLIAVHIGDKLLYVNDQAIPLTGYTKDELLKMPFWGIFSEDYRELIKKRAFDRLAGKPGPANYEAKILTKDGKIKWVNMTAGIFLYEDKPAIITTLFDITDSKNAEGELKEAKAQAELYLDLMGHDINNFNLVARGYLELMDGMTEDEKLKELVFKPMEAIDNSSRLIQNVQKLQREKSGEYMREVLDLGALVEEVAGQMESAPDRHMHISYSTIKGVHVRSDELLRDVFTNLIGNAIKHSAESPQIDIRMVPEKKDGREYCRVIIDDNGPGVPDDMKEQIFNRLRRGNTKAKGSGLGLYLVKSLVESYAGKVWVEDKVKGDQTKGARFVVELPVV